MSKLKRWNGTEWEVAVVGATGPTGPSGVIAVTAPITNSGTSTSASIGIDQTGITLAQSQVTNLTTDLAAKVATRRDTAANFTSNNPTLASGELGFETDSKLTKLGDGTTAWNSLNYNWPYNGGHLRMTAGNFYVPTWFTAHSGGGHTASLNDMILIPIIIPNSITLTGLNCEVNTAATGGSGAVARLGVYSADSNGQPANLVLDAGTVGVESTGIKQIVVSQALTAGIYWLALGHQVSVSAVAYRNSSGYAPFIGPATNVPTVNATSPNSYRVTSVSGSFPATATGYQTTTNALAPKLWIKA
jgi:hypothetical protein